MENYFNLNLFYAIAIQATIWIGLFIFIIVAVSILVIIAIRLLKSLFSSPSLQPYASLALPVSANPQGKVRAQFFGTTTILISDDKTSVMVDGFFSRPSILNLALNRLMGKIASSNVSRIDNSLSRGRVNKIDALLVTHSHYDHEMDSSTVAMKTGAVLVGSESTKKIAIDNGFCEDQIRVVKNGDTQIIGTFQISFYETPHAPSPRYLSSITKLLHKPAKVSDNKIDKNFSFLVRHDWGNILIVPSANFIPDLFNDVKADVIFLSIGLLGKQLEGSIQTYWNEVVKKTEAKLIIPVHWDKITRPLEESLKPLPYVTDNMERTMSILQELANADGVSIRLAPLFDPFVLPLNNAD